MLSRPISSLETWFVYWGMTLQYSAILRNARKATEFTDFLLKYVHGFHLRTDFKQLIVTEKPVTIEAVPRNLKTVFPLCSWAEYGLGIDPMQRLARIAVRDDTVVWNASHAIQDGVSFTSLMDWFNRGTAPPPSVFPVAPDVELAEQVRTVPSVAPYIQEHDSCTQIEWSHQPIELPEGTRVDSFELCVPCESVQCYNPKTEKFVGLNDSFWRSAMLVGHAFTPTQPSWRCCTWVNLRPFMKPGGVGNVIGSIMIGAPGAGPEWTLADVDAAIRRDFQKKMKNKMYLDYLAMHSRAVPPNPPPGAFFDVSNAGYCPMGDNFIDVFLQPSVLAKHCLMALPLGVVSQFQGGRKKCFIRYSYSRAVFVKKDAEKVFRGVVHSLQHFKGNLKVKDALKELRELFATWD
jgi:hypothetical protein